MLNPASPLARLLDAPMRPGVVEWIGLRPARHAPIRAVSSVIADPEHGLVGDHYAGRPGGARQVSLIAREHLAAIAACLGRDELAPELLRRNLLLSGINPFALKDRRFRIGDALLETTGECHPCSRMEQILGPGGYNAVRGNGGILARIIEGGAICVGAAVVRILPAEHSNRQAQPVTLAPRRA